MQYKNNQVEKFLLLTVQKNNPEIQTSTTHLWARNYYLEQEDKHLFHSSQYANEEERAEAMFPGMPEEELKLIACKFYIHRSKPKEKGGHGEDHKKRIEELEGEITNPELVAAITQQWWED